jgi:hypothetical protein
MSEDDIIKGIQQPGRFDAIVDSEDVAKRLIKTALPHAVELPPAQSGQPYSSPPKGTQATYQVHPAELSVGNNLPHVKYADWTKGKKKTGGSWGHLFFPPSEVSEVR